MNVKIMDILAIAQTYLISDIIPIAAEIDHNPTLLKTALLGLGKLGLLGLKIPRDLGGLNTDDITYFCFQELIARYSGTLAFLQTQHQSAVGMLVHSKNQELKSLYLPFVSTGEKLLGVGFSHLRKTEIPLLTATPINKGYIINGLVPWLTGYDIFHHGIIAAPLPDGQIIFALIPMIKTIQANGGNIQFSSVMELGLGTATNTVEVNFDSWFIKEEDIVFIQTSNWIKTNDKNNILKATSLNLGCAKAGLDLVEQVAKIKKLAFIQETLEVLTKEINQCKSEILQEIKNSDLSYNERLKLRTNAIDLALRCAQAAVTVSSGAANSKNHPAQRIYQQALLFTVTGQTTDIMQKTLNKLTRKNTQKNHHQITYTKIIDLSHKIDEKIPLWTGDPVVQFKTVATLEKQGYYLRSFTLGEHSATHINAPSSFYENGISIEQYEPHKLIIPAVVINITEKVINNHDYCLTIADVLIWEKTYNKIGENSLILLYTGWQEKWTNEKEFLPQDDRGKMHFPGFSSEVINFLLTERNISGVGIDTHGIDGGRDENFSINMLVLEQEKIVLENLTNLQELPPKGITIIIGLLKLVGGSGSPVSVLALI
jgi:kynurenine formamidase/alkylation response protein AidB-like acyl-CoA dehydrogenase